MTSGEGTGRIPDPMPVGRRPFKSFDILAVVALTFAVFFHEHGLSPLEQAHFDNRYGAIPAIMWDAWAMVRKYGPHVELLPWALPLVTANYLHVDLGHIVGNMVFFWVFASVLSDAVGHVLWLVIYLVAGAIAVLIYVHANPTSEVPMVGASGAIAGLEGAYFTLVLRWDVPPSFVWPFEVPIPAARLAFLAVFNFVLDTGSFALHSDGHVAYGAHVGGFLGGALVAMTISTVWTPSFKERVR